MIGLDGFSNKGMTVIKYDDQIMKSRIAACREANNNLHEAESLLAGIQEHDDWTCKERQNIIDKLEHCKKEVTGIANDHDALLDVLGTIEGSWQEAEGKIISMFGSVDTTLQDALSVLNPNRLQNGHLILSTLFGVIPPSILSLITSPIGVVPFGSLDFYIR